MYPVAASMQMRPCFSSASRSHLISRKSEKYSGSKPVSASARPLDWHEAAVRKGIAFIGLATPVGPITAGGQRGVAVGTSIGKDELGEVHEALNSS